MSPDGRMISPEEARSVSLRFMRGKFYRGTVTVGRVEVSSDRSSYHLSGNIEIPSRGVLSRLLSPPSKYTFTMQVDVSDGRILGYEVR